MSIFITLVPISYTLYQNIKVLQQAILEIVDLERGE